MNKDRFAPDLVNLILQAEREYGVGVWRHGEMPIWPLTRNRLFFGLFAHYFSAEQAKQTRRLGQAAATAKFLAGIGARYARAGISDANKNGGLRKPAEVLFFSDGVSFASLEGAYYDRYCDPLISECEARSVTTSLLTAGHWYLTPRYSPSIFVQPSLDMVNVAAALGAHRRPPNLYIPGHIELLSLLQKNGYPTASCTMEKIGIDAARAQALVSRFSVWLRTIRPKLVFIVSYYSIQGMALIYACRKLGIPTVDIQHGAQGDMHVAYASWGAIPESCLQLLPNYFWVWGQDDADLIGLWANATESHRAIIGGNPMAEAWHADTAPIVRRFDTIARSVVPNRPSFQVLVTLQAALSDAEMITPLLQAIQAAPDDLFWWIRLHPMMLERMEELARLFEAVAPGRVSVRAATSLPLYAVLRQVDVHVTHSSSTVLEAIEFGRRSIIVNSLGAEYCRLQIERGEAEYLALDSPAFLETVRRRAQEKLLGHGRWPLVAPALNRLLCTAGIASERSAVG